MLMHIYFLSSYLSESSTLTQLKIVQELFHFSSSRSIAVSTFIGFFSLASGQRTSQFHISPSSLVFVLYTNTTLCIFLLLLKRQSVKKVISLRLANEIYYLQIGMLSSPRNHRTMQTVSSRRLGVMSQGISTRFPTTPSTGIDISAIIINNGQY